jgi:hypothetical protein
MKVELFRLLLTFLLAVLFGSAGHFLGLPATASLLLAVSGAIIISRLATLR